MIPNRETCAFGSCATVLIRNTDGMLCFGAGIPADAKMWVARVHVDCRPPVRTRFVENDVGDSAKPDAAMV